VNTWGVGVGPGVSVGSGVGVGPCVFVGSGVGVGPGGGVGVGGIGTRDNREKSPLCDSKTPLLN
jgi:hypothetical protein